MKLTRQTDGAYRTIDERFSITRVKGGWEVRRRYCRMRVTVPSLREAREIAAADWIQDRLRASGLTKAIRESFADDLCTQALLDASLRGIRTAFYALLCRLDRPTRKRIDVFTIWYCATQVGILPLPRDNELPFANN